MDDARARNALSKALHHLRRTLGENALTARGNELVGIDPQALWCDASAFERAIAEGRNAAALDLYKRGDLLDGFRIGDANGFEHWLDGVRQRLRREAMGAVKDLIREAERAGDLAAATQWARRAAELSPHDESLLRELLLKLGQTGDRAGALTAYHAFAHRLARDLDMEPSAETRALAESFRGSSSNGSGGELSSNELEVLPPVSTNAPSRTVPASVERAHGAHGAHGAQSARRPPGRILLAVSGIAATALAGIVYFGEPTQDLNRVAVGLLRNQTGNAALNPIADMATGNIVQQLSQSGQEVVDLRDVGVGMRGAGAAVENRELARAAGAGKVVGGDMFRKGDSLVVQMQILDSKDGRVLHHLGAVSAPVTNAYTILDRIRGGVTGAVAALADTLYLPWTTAHSRPPNFAAFQEFMQGLDAIVNQGARPAIVHLKKAIALDTGFVEAKLWLIEQADLYPEERRLVDSVLAVAMAQRPTLGPFDQVSLDREAAFIAGDWARAYSASRRLVSIAPNTPDAHVFHAQAAMATRRYDEAIAVLHRIDRTKGWLKNLGQLDAWDLQAHRLKGDLAGAVSEWRRARSAKPEDFTACSNGILILSAMGRESAVDSLVRECTALPTAPPTPDRLWEQAGKGFRSRGYVSASRRAFEKSLTLRVAAADQDPKRRKALAMIQCELGLWKDAYVNLRVTADSASAEDRKNLGVVAAHLGDTITVKETLAWIEAWKRTERTRGGASLNRAFVVLALGRRDEAIRLLREAKREGSAPAWAAWYVRFELQPLRGDMRFEELIRPES